MAKRRRDRSVRGMLAACLRQLWKSFMVEKTVNLGFINRDVQAQLTQSREILAVVQLLKEALPNIENETAKSKVEESIKRLLGIVGALTNNANTTSSIAAITVSSSTGSGL